MKKIILSLASLFVFAAAVNAAEPLTNKNGQKILPEAGDIALGVDATPFLNYFGNFFGKTTNNNSANSAFTGKDYSIYMKYFLTDQSAVRLAVNFGFNKQINKGLVTNDGEIQNNPDATAIDVMTRNENRLLLSGGYEMRRGHGRLQGYWGAQASLGFATSVTKYQYANEMTATNINPSTYNFGSNITGTNPTTRVIENKSPSAFNAGVGGFVGVEYFFAPKMSIAGELGLGWNYTWHNQGSQYEITTQTYNPALGVIETSRRENSGGFNNFGGLGTYTSGNLALLFHF